MALAINTTLIVVLFVASASLQEQPIYAGSWVKCNASGSTRECQFGRYPDNCGICTKCKEIGDVCETSVQCCGTENMACRNFSLFARPQCLCIAEFQYDATVNRCYLPVTIPQQLLLIAVYSALAVMISLGVAATILHVLRSKLGLCMRRKQRRTLEMDLEDQEIRSVIHQTRPPPYTPPDHLAGVSSAGAVAAGLELALPVALHHVSARDPPPAYEDLPRLALLERNDDPPLTTVTMEYEPMMSSSLSHPDSLEEVTIPHIVITPPPSSGERELTFMGNSPSQVPEIIVSAANLTVPTQGCELHGTEHSCFMCELDSSVISGVSYNEERNTCPAEEPQATCLLDQTEPTPPTQDTENANYLEVTEVKSISSKVPFVKIYDPSYSDDAKSGEDSSLPIPVVKFDLTKYFSYQQTQGHMVQGEDGSYTNPACDM